MTELGSSPFPSQPRICENRSMLSWLRQNSVPQASFNTFQVQIMLIPMYRNFFFFYSDPPHIFWFAHQGWAVSVWLILDPKMFVLKISTVWRISNIWLRALNLWPLGLNEKKKKYNRVVNIFLISLISKCTIIESWNYQNKLCSNLESTNV